MIYHYRNFIFSCRISEFVTEADLKLLMENLDGKLYDSNEWEAVIDKSNNHLSYNAKCCKPKVIDVNVNSTAVMSHEFILLHTLM